MGDRTNGHECHGSTSYHFDVVLLSDWFLPTIFEFLDIPDIVKMDSIMLKIKKFVRNDFGTLPMRIQKYLYTDESIEWCVKRNISFKNLDLAIHSGVINRKNFSITTKGVSQLAKLCIELKDLQLFSFSAAGCPNIWLQEIAKYSKQLRFLSILGSVTISDEALTGTNIYRNHDIMIMCITVRICAFYMLFIVFNTFYRYWQQLFRHHGDRVKLER